MNKHRIMNMDLIEGMIPISRFNKGEAGKIFEEVEAEGIKIAVKNNRATCVLLSINNYKEIVDMVEDYHLALEAYKRLSTCENGKLISHEEVLKSFNMSEDELKDADLEIE